MTEMKREWNYPNSSNSTIPYLPKCKIQTTKAFTDRCHQRTFQSDFVAVYTLYHFLWYAHCAIRISHWCHINWFPVNWDFCSFKYSGKMWERLKLLLYQILRLQVVTFEQQLRFLGQCHRLTIDKKILEHIFPMKWFPYFNLYLVSKLQLSCFCLEQKSLICWLMKKALVLCG